MTIDKPTFDPSSVPRFVPPPHLAGAPDLPETRWYDETCCTDQVCPQRDYNRACLLMLTRLSNAYAAMLLARESTRNLWKCDAAGHTVDCPDSACVFGREMDEAMGLVQKHFERTVVGLFVHLSTVSVDLAPQWQDFSDMEMAAFGLFGPMPVDEPGVYREMLRKEATDYDDVEHARWYRPPPSGPAV